MKVVAWFLTTMGLILVWGASDQHPLVFVFLIGSAIKLAIEGFGPDFAASKDDFSALGSHRHPGGDR